MRKINSRCCCGVWDYADNSALTSVREPRGAEICPGSFSFRGLFIYSYFVLSCWCWCNVTMSLLFLTEVIIFLKTSFPVLRHWIRCVWCHLQWNCHLRATPTCESEQNCQKEHLLQVHSGCSWRPERCVSSSAHFKKGFTLWEGGENPLGF